MLVAYDGLNAKQDTLSTQSKEIPTCMETRKIFYMYLIITNNASQVYWYPKKK